MRYFLGFILAVALIVAVFILILRGLGGGHAPLVNPLTDYAETETVMRMIEEGPINVDQNHRSLSVVVGRSNSSIDLVQGYEGHVLDTKSYASNEAGYAKFLRALQLSGYTKGDIDPNKEDSRGVCPLGNVYTFEIVTGASTVQRFWTTSCGGGTFKGNLKVVKQLFRAQIPDYFNLIRGTQLN
jgi:hypothetical protein